MALHRKWQQMLNAGDVAACSVNRRHRRLADLKVASLALLPCYEIEEALHKLSGSTGKRKTTAQI